MQDGRGAVNPRRVKEVVEQGARQFRGYGQQDAHEFLSFLQDQMHEEVLAQNRALGASIPSSIDANFAFTIEHVRSCLGCGVSNRYVVLLHAMMIF